MQNRRVIIPDTESDLDDDSDELIDNANLTKQSSSHSSSNIKPSIDVVSGVVSDAVSENSSDDNLGNASSKSNDDNTSDDDLDDAPGTSNHGFPSATSNKTKSFSDDDLGDAFKESSSGTSSTTANMRELSNGNAIIRSKIHTLSSFERPKTVKRKADVFDPRQTVSKQSIWSENNGERPEQRQRTRGKKVNYDMKHHPMDDVLRPKYSAKRRANGLKPSKNSSDFDAESDEDVTTDSVGGKVIQSLSPRRSSRKINQSATPIYSGKWHPLDQMLKDNATSASKSSKSHKSSNTSLSTLKDEEDSNIVHADLESDQDVARVPDLWDETASIQPDIRRSARVSVSQKNPPNYDMKYVSN